MDVFDINQMLHTKLGNERKKCSIWKGYFNTAYFVVEEKEKFSYGSS